jgi:Bacterial membrane protein YfhO
MKAAPRPHSHDRPGVDLKDWHCLAILTLLAGLFFRDIILGTAYFWEDFLYQNYPFRSFAATSMAFGQLPLWNPYIFGGMPFLADIQTAVFYLPSTALTLAVHHGALHHYWLEIMIILHYPLAGGGMFFLARSFGMQRVSALFSGLAFMLSGFMIAHAIHQQIVTLAAWYPAMLLLFRRALQQHQWMWVCAGAAVLGHSTLAGFPQLSLYLYSLLGLFFLFELFSTYRGARLLSRDARTMTARAAAIVLLSLAIAGLQLLPTMELSPFSQRAEITYAKSTEGSLSWGQLLTFIFPKYFGTSRAEQYAYWGPGDYWHFWETCVYVGIPTLLLALFTLPLVRRHKYVLFFWGLLGLSLLYALGGNFPLQRIVFDTVPGFSLFRNPARTSVLISFAAALLAGWGLDALLSREGDTRNSALLRRIVLAAAATAAAVWILTATGALHSAFPFLSNPRVAAAVQRDTLAGMGFLLATGALLYYALRKRPLSPGLALFLPALLFLDMSWFGGNQPLSTVNPAEYFSRSRRIVEPLKREGEKELFRISTRTAGGMVMDRNQGMIDRLFTMEGYTPLALKRRFPPLATADQLNDLMNVKYKTVTEEGGRISFVHQTTYLPRAFVVHRMYVARNDSDCVRYLSSTEFDPRSIAVFDSDPGFALPASVASPSWKAEVTAYANNEIALDVETSAEGILVLSELYYPGWTATVDGMRADVHRVDYNLRGIVVPAGRHAVVVLFTPSSFSRGMFITLAALGVCGIGFAVSFRRRRRNDS